MIEHLSYSSVSSYLSCPRAWRYRYVEKVESPVSPELVFGSAWHDTIEHYIAARSAGGPAPELIATWQEAWGKQVSEKNVAWGSNSAIDYQNEGIRMLTGDGLAPVLDGLRAGADDEGLKIERKVTLSVPGVPVPVIGYIDLIDEAGIPHDFKTSARAWTQDKAENETQSLFYLAALNQAGMQVPGWQFRHVVFTKTTKPQVQVLAHRHTPGQVMWIFEMIKEVWNGIQYEVFPPNPTGWKCSPQYCDFWSMCRGKYG